jgi:D-alanyl-D-alanine carboxypeptidase
MRSARTSVFLFAAALAAPAGAAAREPELPAAITAVMDKPRYEDARWSLVVAELKTAKTVYALDPDRISFTDLDHNDANSLGTAILTPQDPLYALSRLARQVKAAGIKAVAGEVAVDDRLFEPYRVSNGTCATRCAGPASAGHPRSGSRSGAETKPWPVGANRSRKADT